MQPNLGERAGPSISEDTDHWYSEHNWLTRPNYGRMDHLWNFIHRWILVMATSLTSSGIIVLFPVDHVFLHSRVT